MTQSADRSTSPHRRWIIGLTAAILVLIVAAVLLTSTLVRESSLKHSPASVGAVSEEQLAALPELRPDATIDGLVDFTAPRIPDTTGSVYTVIADTPVFGGANGDTPVARIGPLNELGSATSLVIVEQTGRWSLVLTPSANGTGASQTAGWVLTDALQRGQDLPHHVEIALDDSTLSIVDADGAVQFTSVIELADKPSVPAGLGYIHARYTTTSGDDPSEPVTLTSLHAPAPFSDLDGSSIALHVASPEPTDDFRGAIAMNDEAAERINALPIGTMILIK